MPRRLLFVLAALVVAIAPTLLHSTWRGAPVGPASPAPAAAAPTRADPDFAPLDRAGPAFTVPADTLAASLSCTIPPPAGPPRDPVLLLSGTGLDPAPAFDWNYQPALSAAGIAWCTSTAPAANTGDIQVRAEYVAFALRETRARAGRTVAVIGHGQGALAARLALRFWPELRGYVSDLVGLSPPNHGTDAYLAGCAAACPPAYWQQRSGSALVAAVNSGQRTFDGIDYTVLTSETDDVVTPHPAAAALPAAGPGRVRNVALQDVCPGYPADHLGIGGYDPVAWALAVDALGNDGPADPARVDRAVCEAAFMPGVDADRFLDNSARAAVVLEHVAPPVVPTVPTEPALSCWVLAEGCATAGAR